MARWIVPRSSSKNILADIGFSDIWTLELQSISALFLLRSLELLLHPIEILLQWLYLFDEPSLVRDRPMKVLALGLSRCGTESLKFALEDLGYKGVYHGFDVRGDECMVWTRLWDAKASGLGTKIGVEDFDRLIGNCEAVTDGPGFMFARELIEAYPDAKVWLF